MYERNVIQVIFVNLPSLKHIRALIRKCDQRIKYNWFTCGFWNMSTQITKEATAAPHAPTGSGGTAVSRIAQQLPSVSFPKKLWETCRNSASTEIFLGSHNSQRGRHSPTQDIPEAERSMEDDGWIIAALNAAPLRLKKLWMHVGKARGQCFPNWIELSHQCGIIEKPWTNPCNVLEWRLPFHSTHWISPTPTTAAPNKTTIWVHSQNFFSLHNIF